EHPSVPAHRELGPPLRNRGSFDAGVADQMLHMGVLLPAKVPGAFREKITSEDLPTVITLMGKRRERLLETIWDHPAAYLPDKVVRQIEHHLAVVADYMGDNLPRGDLASFLHGWLTSAYRANLAEKGPPKDGVKYVNQVIQKLGPEYQLLSE